MSKVLVLIERMCYRELLANEMEGVLHYLLAHVK